MTAPKFSKADLKQLSQGLAFCGVPIGDAGSINNMLGMPTLGEALPLALVLGVFLGAGVWMFRRWGKSSSAPTTTEISPETAVDPQRERELVNV
jgi:hypothetical protein